jgi:DNA repair protein RecN (Recombination protein N)
MSVLEELSIETTYELIIRRVLDSSGKSKFYVNDIRVSLAVLRNITKELFEMHGQREQYSILDISKHRELLDSYAKNEKLLNKLFETYNGITVASKELQRILDLKNTREQEKSFLEFVIGELKALDVQDGEESQLVNQRIQLKSLEKRNTLISQIINEIDHSNIEKILFDIQKVIYSNDTIFSQYKTQQSTINSSTEAAVDEIAKIKECFQNIIAKNPDTKDLHSIETRLFALKDASAKYNKPIDKLAHYLEECQLKLKSLSEYEENIEAFNHKLSELKDDYYKTSKILSESRKKAALVIEKKIMKELAYLKLDKAVFKISIENNTSENITPYGTDKVSFLASTNPGQSLSLLNKVASGGELSRFMLAIKLILANRKDASTLIFDEIDTGIGGATADAVGNRLQSLSTVNQLIVVTHHPQVASKANMHIVVKKCSKKDSTSVSIEVLNTDMKRQEIARMLSGAVITDEAIAAADNLLVASLNDASNNMVKADATA